jgi:hypothetical protein
VGYHVDPLPSTKQLCSLIYVCLLVPIVAQNALWALTFTTTWGNPDSRFGPAIVGEWSLATDSCAMWLNEFNDNLSGYLLYFYVSTYHALIHTWEKDNWEHLLTQQSL